jgi:hypothetical protein
MTVLLATSEAFSKTFGLIVVFGGIGVLVNIIIVYIASQVRGERHQNQGHLSGPESTRQV